MLSCVVTLHCFWFFVSDSTLLVTPTNCLKELVNVNLNKFFFFRTWCHHLGSKSTRCFFFKFVPLDQRILYRYFQFSSRLLDFDFEKEAIFGEENLNRCVRDSSQLRIK